MKATGIVRRIDDLGRVVIPKEIRRTMRIREGDPLEIYTDKEGGVIFKKYSLLGGVDDFAEQLCETLCKCTGFLCAVADRDSVIAAAGGGTPKLFRAPSGSYNNTLIKTAAEQGFCTIQWDVDSRDWKNPDPSEMVTKVTENVRCGSIILFHSGAKPTAKALLQILDILSQQGYSFITVSELIYKDNYTINNEGRQIKLADAA